MINKSSKQNYYNKNREKVRKQQEKYRQENKEFYNTSVYNSRKNKSNMLKAKGQIYTFLPDEERYNAMTLSLAKKLKIPITDIPEEWPDSSNNEWLTPGTIAVLGVFLIILIFITIYTFKYCSKRKKQNEEFEDSILGNNNH